MLAQKLFCKDVIWRKGTFVRSPWLNNEKELAFVEELICW